MNMSNIRQHVIINSFNTKKRTLHAFKYSCQITHSYTYKKERDI